MCSRRDRSSAISSVNVCKVQDARLTLHGLLSGYNVRKHRVVIFQQRLDIGDKVKGSGSCFRYTVNHTSAGYSNESTGMLTHCALRIYSDVHIFNIVDEVSMFTRSDLRPAKTKQVFAGM